MKDEILKIVTDALKGAGARFDTDGQTVWVDGKDGRTFAVCVNECVGDDDSADGRKQTYTVHLHASFMGAFDVKAESDSEAEEIVRDRFKNEDIKVSDLEFESVTVDAELAGEGGAE